MNSRPLVGVLTAGLLLGGTGGVIAAAGGTSSGSGSAAVSQYQPGPHHKPHHKPKPHHHHGASHHKPKPKPRHHRYRHLRGHFYQNDLPNNPRHGFPFRLVVINGHRYHVYHIHGHTQIFRVSKVNTKAGEIEIRVSSLPKGA